MTKNSPAVSFLAIVPMKAHSERMPDKNIRNFNGKPLFYWIFQTLAQVESVAQIVLDTDSDRIAQMVCGFFPDVVVSMRPEHLRGDFVSTNALIEHILTLFPDQHYFLQTHATNPCLRPDTIRRAITLFTEDAEHDSLFSVTRLQTRLFDKTFKPLNHDPYRLLRTQDLDPVYEENSNLYLFTRSSFGETGGRIGKKPILFEMNRLEAYDIDTEEDFVVAQILHKNFLAT
ncbi:MAG: acylneuraminate cytidylyltransferase family protein [Desulfobacterota bacterium]|nr:acylneuraminate cytidylyltransferase family protein [Thermodesulfobacteriota bacterium]